jgi:hypothetical protein
VAGDPKSQYYRRVQQLYDDINQLLSAKPGVNARSYFDLYRRLVVDAEGILGSAPPLPDVNEMRLDETAGLRAVMGLNPYVGQLLAWAKDEAGFNEIGFA